MIGFLRGTEAMMTDDVLCLYVGTPDNGIGYNIHVIEPFTFNKTSGFFIHEHAPQDAPHELYGFATVAQCELFRRLINIKGVGPKAAQRIVASGITVFGPDPSCLTKIRGVGATLAQRIVEELS